MGASSSNKIAVLLLAHGSPEAPADVPEFLLHVTGGRPLPRQVIEEVRHRHEVIGGSPLTRLTLEQGKLLVRKLGMPVYVGMRNWKPYLAETLEAMTSDGVERAIVICLAPQNSRTSVGLYREGLNGIPFAFEFVESWHDHPLLVSAFAEKLKAGLASLPDELSAQLPIIFTAHSVPRRTITEGDPYEEQARETAELVAREAGVGRDVWSFAFQSQGMSGGEWLGPTVEETILRLKTQGHRGVFVQPVGFVCDHVEILYDVDVGFRKFAAKEGMRLWRAESLNDSRLLTAALASIVRSRMG